MRVAVVGPGAMGLLFTHYFSGAGHRVTLIDRDPERAARLNSEGAVFIEGGRRTPFSVSATSAIADDFDLFLIAVKTWATKEAAETIKTSPGNRAPVLSIQNGIGSGDVISSALGPDRILLGVTSMGATLLDTGVVRQGGRGPTVIGPHVDGTAEPPGMTELFASSGLETSFEDPIAPHIWRKLAVNCAINPVTAILGGRNAIVAENPHAARLAATAATEVARVAACYGVALGDEASLAEWVFQVARKTAANRSSMGQDIDRGGRTEIESINGAVAALAEARGIPAPLNKVLTEMVLALTFGREAGKGTDNG